MASTKAAIKKAINDVIMAAIDRENYGMFSTRNASHASYDVLNSNNVKIDHRANVVYQDGKPIYSIKRRYSSRKSQGMYKQLKPVLVEL